MEKCQSSVATGPSVGKIAYLMSFFPKLTETFVLYEALALEEAGARVELHPLLRGCASVEHPETRAARARYYPLLSPAVVRSQWHFLRRRPRTYLGLLFEVLRATWGSANFFLGALGIFPKCVHLAREMQRQGVTHVHAHFCNHPALAAFIIHRLTGVPFSFTAHGSDLHVERRMLDRKLEAARFAVAISDYNRRLMIEECGEMARRKVHVIHCGVDPHVFVPRRALRSSGEPLRIACVASLEEVKGHRYLIEACRLLRERGVDLVCDLVGEGPLRRSLEAQVASVGLRGRVRFHGALPRSEVARLVSRADAAVLASVPTRRGKREGIPVCLMEAMASALPVVASNLSGIPELVAAGRTGLLVPPGDGAALADALERLARDPGLCERLGRAGRERVLREFDVRRSAAQLLRLFAVSAPA